MKQLKRLVITAAGGVVVMAAILTACGPSTPTYYRPAAYGENGRCYYVQSPAEAMSLRAAGLCQASWVPYPMPLYWHLRYAGYYDSPAYSGVYVAPASRAAYTKAAQSFEKTNSAKIQTEQKRATWLATTGKKTATVSGSKVDYGKAGFSSGNVRSSGFSSGYRCSAAFLPYGGSSSGGRSGGFSSGGSRSGGFSSGGRSSGGSRISGGSKSGSGYSGGTKSYGRSGTGRIGGTPSKSAAKGIC